MIRVALFIFLVSLSDSLLAQHTTIKGRITSEGKPVAFATVGVTKTTYGVNADDNGNYKLTISASGTIQLEYTALGYYKVYKNVNVEKDKVYTINVEMISDEKNLNEVTVSGTMKEVSRQNSPVPVEIYTPKFFLKNPTSNMFEALQMVNGVQPTLNCNVCNTGDIHINGMEGPYTMILIDGMPIVSSLSTVYGLSGIPNSMIERIEIVKGPASTLYGSEAVAGLINVITKNPLKAPRVSADVFATTYGEYNADAAITNKWKYANTLFSMNYFNFSNKWDVNNDGFTDVTLQNRYSVFNKWSFVRKKEREAAIALRYYKESRYGGQMQFDQSWRGSDSVYGESIYTDRFELIGNYQLPIKEKLKLMYSFNNHEQNSYYGKIPFMAKQRIAFGQLIWDKRISLRHDFLAGVALRYNYYDDNTPATRSADTFTNQPTITWLPGLFVQDEITISAQSKLLLGLRYDEYKDHGSIFSPRANYKWSANPYNTLRFSAGNGFRVVNLFTEEHAALTGARVVEVKEKLKPEQSWNVNLNYNRFVNLSKGFFTFDASIFYTYFTNRIIANYDIDPDKIIYDNLNGHAISQGISMNVDANFTLPLKIIAGCTLMDVYKIEKDSLGNEVKSQQQHAPKFSGTFQVSYTFTKINLVIDWTGQVYGPMKLPILPNDYRPEYSPWFTLQNIQLTQKIGKGFQLYGGLKNIFNFLPKDPIIRAFDPFDKHIAENNPNGYTFDPSYNYASMQGVRGFLGLRYALK